jgi:hypothetical protein
MKSRTYLIALLFCAGSAVSAIAQPNAEFAKAYQEYAQGNFKEAIVSYEALVRADEWNANLFYDLGNAYFRTRDFGRAILNYERALALDQHHPEATANLQIARDESRALELQPTRLERYLQFASINQYSIAAAIAFWLGIFGIVALIFARRRSAALMSLSVLCLLVCAVAVWAIYTLDNSSKGRALAIVTGNDVQARLATADTPIVARGSPRNPPSGPLHEPSWNSSMERKSGATARDIIRKHPPSFCSRPIRRTTTPGFSWCDLPW